MDIGTTERIGKPEGFRPGYRCLRVLVLTLIMSVSSGCISYKIRTTSSESDRLVEDTRALHVKQAFVNRNKLQLQLAQDGYQKFERTTSYDRHVKYDIKSNVVYMWKDMGASPALIFVGGFAIINDIIGLVATTLIQVPIGAIKSVTAPDPQTSSVVNKLPNQVKNYQNIIVRFGPRMVTSGQCNAKGWVTVDARPFAQKILAQGGSSVKVQVIFPDSDLSARLTLNKSNLQSLAK